jgi:ABC-type branched-subunit amino acid transport system permease subunit/ABC-type branched-subunit amino acid transport system ATPase component
VSSILASRPKRLDRWLDCWAELSQRRWAGPIRILGPWVLAALALYVFATSTSAYVQLITGTVIIYAISAIGLNVLMGQAGLVSIGNAALMAVGAFTTAILSPKAFWGAFPIPIIASAIVGGAVGLLIALPALRLKGIYLALATLALQYIVQFAGDQYESHTNDISGVPVSPLKIGAKTFSYGSDFVLLLGVFLGLTVLVVRALSRHPAGRMWNALRESELAATAIGVNAGRWKLTAFVVSSAIVSVAGSLYAYFNQIVSADSFTLDFAIVFIVILIVGGMGTITGAIVGSIVVVSLPYVLTSLTSGFSDGGIGGWLANNVPYVNNGLYGILVLVVLLYLPEGVVPALGRLGHWAARRVTVNSSTGNSSTGNSSTRDSGTVSAVAADASGRVPPVAGDELLRTDGLEVRYQNGARAVNGIRLRVRPHSIVAILGRNGAGKTSTLRAISGFLVAEGVKVSGTVDFNGRSTLGMAPARTADLGMVLVPERSKVFPSLTVGEHLRLATSGGYQDVLDRPYFTRLRERLDQPAGLLSGGERQLLALATATLLRPQLLMVDEFSLGLAPVMISEVSRVIRGLREQGMTIVIVEQNAAAALELADWVYLMEAGTIVAEGPPADMAQRLALTGQGAS